MNSLRSIASCFLVSTVLLSCLTGLAQSQQSPVSASAQTATSHVPVPFAVEIKKAVAFIEADCFKDGKVVPYSATAFFLVKPDERLGKDRGFEYLVTNRHAAQPGIEDGAPCQVVNYFVKLNLRSNDPAHPTVATPIPLGPKLPWVFPDDPSVDLAIIPFAADQSKVDFEPIPTTMLATDDIVKANGIGEGDPVIFAGLFVQVPGLIKLEPIVRQGIIAMIPDEAIGTTLKRPGSLYLADVHVFGGNSGAPMFVNLGGFRNGSLIAGNNYKLLGVVSGYEKEDADFNLQAATTYSGKLGMNSGVASVVPAKELDALLNGEQLQSQRDLVVKQGAK
jgi:hypothetical protein